MALERSKIELLAAERALDGMTRATELEDLREHWQTFLDRLQKVWVKVERECQHERRAFQPWQGEYKNKRRTEPLLAYLHHARHVDQHTIQPVVVRRRDLELTLAPGASPTLMFNPDTGFTLNADFIAQGVGPGRIELVTIVDAGVRYYPPTPDPIAAARSGLEFYVDFVAAAEKKFWPAA